MNEREPRDIEASAIIRECVERNIGVPTPTGKFGVWLDSPMIDMLSGEGTVEKEFPGKFILYKRFDIDISKEPMLIYPTLHYQNGGLEFERDGKTALPGFYVAGEVGGGTHGENRLMGTRFWISWFMDVSRVVMPRSLLKRNPKTARLIWITSLNTIKKWMTPESRPIVFHRCFCRITLRKISRNAN